MKLITATASVSFGFEETADVTNGITLELGGYDLSSPYNRFVHQYELPALRNLDREIIAAVGTIRQFNPSPKTEFKIEILSFSKASKATLKYPCYGGFEIINEGAFTAYINNSFVKGYSPRFEFNPNDNSVSIIGGVECWGAVTVKYTTQYDVYLYTAKKPPIQPITRLLLGETKTGTVFSRVGLATATLDMPPYQLWARQPKVEIYRVTSEYLATPKGEMEKPPNYPENRYYDTGQKAPSKNNCIIQGRTHEIVSLSGTEYTSVYRLFYPYIGVYNWRPEFKFIKASPPQGYSERTASGNTTWDDRSWSELDWDKIKADVSYRYPDIKF